MTHYQVALTLKSRNTKTGPIPVSTTTFETCPDECPLRSNGCYGTGGPLAMFWDKVTKRKAGMAWADFVASVAALPLSTLWRHNQVGDLPGNRINVDKPALRALIKANKGKRGFTFTHYDVIHNAGNRAIIAESNKNGFTINLSANNLAHADMLKDMKAGPVAVILPESVHGPQKLATPNGHKVVVCPATYKNDVSCKTCGLCSKQRDAIIGFPAHGPQKKRADAIAA
jgi:hypothetical protein